jgi:hypothetical protein
MWPIQLAFSLSLPVGYSCPRWLFVILHFSLDWCNWSYPSFSSIKFQNCWGIPDLLAEESKFQHHTNLSSKCITLVTSKILKLHYFKWAYVFCIIISLIQVSRHAVWELLSGRRSVHEWVRIRNIGGTTNDRGNQSTRSRNCLGATSATKDPHGLDWNQTIDSAVRTQWLTTWDMEQTCA